MTVTLLAYSPDGDLLFFRDAKGLWIHDWRGTRPTTEIELDRARAASDVFPAGVDRQGHEHPDMTAMLAARDRLLRANRQWYEAAYELGGR